MAKPGDLDRPVLGTILAGGLSRRMGGGDKGLAELGGQSVLARAAARLAPQVSALVLNANGDPARFRSLGLPVLADGVRGHPGPLAGVLAALEMAAGQGGTEWVLTVPCDAPFLPADLVARLRAAARGGAGAAASSGGRRHPTVSLWPVSCREALRRALVEEDVRRVNTIVDRFDFGEAEWPQVPYDPFMNINDRDGLAAAEAVLERWPEA